MIPPDSAAGLAAIAPPRSYRSIHPAMAGTRRPLPIAGKRPAEAMRSIDWIIAGLVLLAVIITFTISSAMLTNWKIHYVTTGGGFYEKFHPATYFSFLAFGLLLLRNNDPIGEINRIFSNAKLVLVYLFCWLCLLIQQLALERPFTVIVDTFLLPAVLCLVIWHLSPAQKTPRPRPMAQARQPKPGLVRQGLQEKG